MTVPCFLLAGRVRVLPPVASPSDDRYPLPAPDGKLSEQRWAEGTEVLTHCETWQQGEVSFLIHALVSFPLLRSFCWRSCVCLEIWWSSAFSPETGTSWDSSPASKTPTYPTGWKYTSVDWVRSLLDHWSKYQSDACVCLCSIILTTVQYLSPALHKNFTEADFDFKVTPTLSFTFNSQFSLYFLVKFLIYCLHLLDPFLFNCKFFTVNFINLVSFCSLV